jgi:glutathione S-transferase
VFRILEGIMITLIRYAPAFNLPDPSPFGLKAEMLLKLAGLPYRSEIASNPAAGPKGKLPAIRDGGAVIGDSEIIRWHIEQTYKLDLDQGLDAAARATGHAFARMLEERTYWAIVYSRWIDNWPTVRAAFFGALPPVVRTLVPLIAHRKVRSYLHGHGLGRHSRDEIYAMAARDIRAVATQLADTPYFMGGAPSSADATVYAFTASIMDASIASPLKDEALRHANLVAYNARLRERFYGTPAAAAA